MHTTLYALTTFVVFLCFVLFFRTSTTFSHSLLPVPLLVTLAAGGGLGQVVVKAFSSLNNSR